MADREIKISFSETKMEALAFFLGENNTTVESALKEQLDKLYDKNVPPQVKKFVEREVPGQHAVQEEGTSQRRTRGQGRRSGRQTAAGQTAHSQESPEIQQPDTESVQETEEEPNMAMVM